MAKATPPTPKKVVTKKTTPVSKKSIQQTPLNDGKNSSEEEQQTPTKIVFIDSSRENKNLSADDISNFKNQTSLQHLVLKNQAIANNVNRGNMIAFEQDAVDKEHKRLTGKPFFNPQENNSDIWMWSILCDVLLITLFFAVRAISKQEKTIVEIVDRHNNLVFENSILKQQLSSPTTKAE